MNYYIVSTVLERDLAANYHLQGGAPDPYECSSQQVIRDAGFWDDFRKDTRHADQESKSVPNDGKEINRSVHRNMLLEAAGHDIVRWDHALEADKFDLHFRNGKVETGLDLVIGADKAWSQSHSFVTLVAPFYARAWVIEVSMFAQSAAYTPAQTFSSATPHF
ncbi:hypothetical protein BDV93DRAFT_560470 [Ceratobasidium sp. AG-I]|nr:hypothetical protein BDV93DRAFT_560470 [Ceratobasidium sp. AG-I]